MNQLKSVGFASVRNWTRRPRAWGAVCGVGAAVGYTTANTFLRQLADDTPAVWVSTIKATCTVVIFAPWLAYLGLAGNRILPSLKVVMGLIAAALFAQFGGNVLYQVALGDIGMALTVPLTLGTMIVTSAIVGRTFLGEPVTYAMAISLLILISSIIMLSLGANQVGELAQAQQSYRGWSWTRGALTACTAGVAYAVLGVAIRVSMRSRIPLATPMVFVGVAGMLGLGTICYFQLGAQLLSETSALQWRLMLLAGLANSLAFLALTNSLKLLPIVYVNAINVSQVALAAIIGIAVFSEPLTVWLIAGLTMMLIAFAVLGRRFDRRSKMSPGQPGALATSSAEE